MADKKKLLIVGASGLLGSKIMSQASSKYDVAGSYNPQVDGKSAAIQRAYGAYDELESLRKTFDLPLVNTKPSS